MVFISAASDTRYNFTDHLLAALNRKPIETFTHFNYNTRKPISPETIQVIQQSRISIVVFSTNYASSAFCLDQLAKIAECIDSVEQVVWPIFYDLDPSEIKQQSGVFEKAFAEHEKTFKSNLEKVETWRKSVIKVANLPGWDLRNRLEAEVVDEIIKRIMEFQRLVCIEGISAGLVGMQSRTEEFEKLLDLGSDGVTRVVGICGMGGIGKTTLARVVYHRISHQFESSCFLPNIEDYMSKSGLFDLQKKLLCDTLQLKGGVLRDVEATSLLILTRLKRLKTLLVLDEVESSELLEKLIGNNAKCFGVGSRIIITTRDERVLKKYGVDEIYKVELLNNDEAREFFCSCAFKCDYFSKDYEDLIWEVLENAKGLPLAVKVSGLHLYNRSVHYWQSYLKQVQVLPNHKIMLVFKRSFDRLSDLEKTIFLDIACFFVGEEIHFVKEILSHCRLHPEIGIPILIEKSLMSISDQTICMHDLVRKMGRGIVLLESYEKRGKRSRLWLYEDFCHVMNSNSGTNYIEAIVINQEDPEGAQLIRAEGFSKMINLRLLIIRNLKFSGNLEYLSNSLEYLSWHNYHFSSLPSSFEPHKLVELIMSHSNITRLWEGIKILPNLRSMNLRDSKDLIKMPDFKGLPNLVRLDLEGCIGLLQIDPSISILKKLTHLNLRNCTSLISVPNSLFDLSSIEILNLAGCSKLAECLNFDPLRSSLEVKLLRIPQPSFYKIFLYYIVRSLSKGIMNNNLVFKFLSWLVDRMCP